MKILHYNWVDYLDEEARGGGVTVYQRNIMAALDAAPWAEPYFLASGLSYDLKSAPPRWEPVAYGPRKDRDRRFEIINSEVQSPAHHSFGDPAQVDAPMTEAVFLDFVAQTGPYDVIHFNNLEGLPARVLAVKERWPETQIVLSLHNYYPFCPQVNLWFQERESCVDFDAGRACAKCLVDQRPQSLLRMSGAMAYRLKRAGIRPGTWAYDTGFRWAVRSGGRLLRMVRSLRGRTSAEPVQPVAPKAPDGRAFVARRAAMQTLINAHCDHVLCMSDAVRDLALHYGIRPNLARTSYIGTRQADAWQRTTPAPTILGADGTLTLCFMGYMRRDKGLFFLLDALESLPPAQAARINLIVAARRGDTETMARLSALDDRLAGVEHIDGYSAGDLDDMLARVDVGVIPVLWHDNLPQVALEMHARHIPLLTADMGGAQELSRCPDMTFAAGDVADFHARIAAILSGQVDATAYWAGAMPPVDMATHLAELRRYYSAAARPAG